MGGFGVFGAVGLFDSPRTDSKPTAPGLFKLFAAIGFLKREKSFEVWFLLDCGCTIMF